jgi:hypothetical protein
MACKMCKAQDARFTCRHNPSTTLGNHLLMACEGFQESAHWRDPEEVQKGGKHGNEGDILLLACELCVSCPMRRRHHNPIAAKWRGGVQERQLQTTLTTGDIPSKEAVRTGHELLMGWCTATATAPNGGGTRLQTLQWPWTHAPSFRMHWQRTAPLALRCKVLLDAALHCSRSPVAAQRTYSSTFSAQRGSEPALLAGPERASETIGLAPCGAAQTHKAHMHQTEDGLQRSVLSL